MGKVVRALVLGTVLLGSGACGDAEVVLPETLAIVAIQPAHGAVGISVDVAPVVVFSQPLAADLDLDKYITLTQVSPPQERVVSLILSDDGYSVTLSLETALAPSTVYRISLAADLPAADDDIKPLPTTISSSFTTGT